MYRTVRYLACWTKLLHSPLGQRCGFLGNNLALNRKYATGPPWSHSGALGPKNWGKWYPMANGKCQSPIALYSDADHKSLELKLNGYTSPAALTACNIGATISFKSDCAKMDDSPCYITGVHGCWQRYHFNHMHMHWGETSTDGSEHTIDDRRFPMELHIVHCLDNLSLAQAIEQPKGLAVLGFMYEIAKEDNFSYAPLVDAMKHALRKDEEKRVKSSPSLTIASLLPFALESSYFYYSGSLTTPPCSEVVHWTIFAEPIPISEKQMEAFRSLHRCSGRGCVEPMSGNWRPLQAANDRQVYQSKTIEIRPDQ